MPKGPQFLADAEQEVGRMTGFAGELLVWLLLFLSPRFLLERVVESEWLPGAVKWAVVATFGLIQLFLAWSIATGRRRKRFLRQLHSLSIVAPLGYSLGLTFFSVGVYAAVMYMLNASGRAGLVAANQAVVLSFSRLQDLFLWHLLAAVPSLNLTDAFRFDRPFSYSTIWAGLLVLMFKVVVIGPILGAFSVWWKLVRRKKR